jgi:hypothetical protein
VQLFTCFHLCVLSLRPPRRPSKICPRVPRHATSAPRVIAHQRMIGSHVGKRHAMGQPVRRQNTQVNARTVRRLDSGIDSAGVASGACYYNISMLYCKCETKTRETRYISPLLVRPITHQKQKPSSRWFMVSGPGAIVLVWICIGFVPSTCFSPFHRAKN